MPVARKESPAAPRKKRKKERATRKRDLTKNRNSKKHTLRQLSEKETPGGKKNLPSSRKKGESMSAASSLRVQMIGSYKRIKREEIDEWCPEGSRTD